MLFIQADKKEQMPLSFLSLSNTSFYGFQGRGEKTLPTYFQNVEIQPATITYCPFSAAVSPSNSSINISVFFWSVTHKRQSSRHM